MAKTIEEFLHSGVKGMRWGVRKDKSSGPVHKDHQSLSNIRKPGGLKKATNNDLRSAIKRLQLLKAYRAGRLLKKGSKASTLSNEELQLAIDKNKHVSSYFKRGRYLLGVKKMRELSKLDNKTLRDYLDRGALEKKYKELRNEEFESAREFIKLLLETPQEIEL